MKTKMVFRGLPRPGWDSFFEGKMALLPPSFLLACLLASTSWAADAAAPAFLCPVWIQFQPTASGRSAVRENNLALQSMPEHKVSAPRACVRRMPAKLGWRCTDEALPRREIMLPGLAFIHLIWTAALPVHARDEQQEGDGEGATSMVFTVARFARKCRRPSFLPCGRLPSHLPAFSRIASASCSLPHRIVMHALTLIRQTRLQPKQRVLDDTRASSVAIPSR